MMPDNPFALLCYNDENGVQIVGDFFHLNLSQVTEGYEIEVCYPGEQSRFYRVKSVKNYLFTKGHMLYDLERINDTNI